MTPPSPCPVRPADDAGAARLRRERAGAVLAQVPVIAAAHIVNAGLVGAVFRHVEPPAMRIALAAWVAAVWLQALVRLVQWARRRVWANAPDAPAGAAGNVAWSILAGMLWGAMAVTLYPVATPAGQVFLAFVCAGMAAGAATTLAPQPAAAAGFIVPDLMPLVARFALGDDLVHRAMATMLLLFGLLMLIIARNHERRFTENVCMRLSIEALLGEVEAARSELEARVAERTAELNTARDEAERANRAKTRFLAAASHDLRQPLQAQVLFHELIVRRARDPALAPQLERMGRALAAQQQILDTLLDVSRIDAGMIAVDRHAFALAPLVERLAQEFGPQAAAKGLALRTVPCTAFVDSDPALLERIVRNLLGNAVKYTDRGRILIGCRRAGAVRRLQVWDTGPGIPGDKLTVVFEEFRQLDNPAGDRNRGLGLGLSIVERLARLLGHRVAVRSRVGRGTVFEVELPVAARPEPAAVPAAPDPAAAAHPDAGLVALVDDDRAVLEALTLSLEDAGYAVAAAGDGEALLARLQGLGRAPEVIVADDRLGRGRTGREAIAAVRAAFGRPIPALLITGDTSPDRLRALSATGLEVLHKPVSPGRLAAAVAALRAGDAPGASPGRAPDGSCAAPELP